LVGQALVFINQFVAVIFALLFYVSALLLAQEVVALRSYAKPSLLSFRGVLATNTLKGQQSINERLRYKVNRNCFKTFVITSKPYQSEAIRGIDIDYAPEIKEKNPFDLSKLVKPEESEESFKHTVVADVSHARKVLDIMAKAHKENPDIVWACDTEVADIDLSLQGPVGNGRVTCVSIYSKCFHGDFGDGPGCALWIDNLGDAEGVLQEFKAWFEDDTVRKVWHNYSFDRHVMGNEGIFYRFVSTSLSFIFYCH
jgi:DNA polymerase I-like protein with 3'-5' exonuclease and polymerase domains